MIKNTIQSIMRKVDKSDGCWEWTGWKNSRGYGRVRYNGKFKQAHRIIYELLNGELPRYLVLDHLCRNKGCVNPSHLEPVTNKENILRGFSVPAKNARKTHCKHGHELSASNIYVYPQGRVCKVCVAVRKKEYRLRDRRNKNVYA
jgi:hypothetical protein